MCLCDYVFNWLILCIYSNCIYYMAKGSNIISIQRFDGGWDCSSTEVLFAVIYSRLRRGQQWLSEASE